MFNIKDILEKREDLSRFVVHLTRDDREDNDGDTARENFEEILVDKKIISLKPHCVFNNKIDEIPNSLKKHFKVACFTEIPLNQIHLLTQKIKGRKIKLEPYGFVFLKEFMISRGAQPAVYINSYDNNLNLRKAVDDLFELAIKRKFKDSFYQLFPLLNAMHERYDFTWEREWRIVGGLKFSLKDIVCVILPEEGEDDLKEKFAIYGISVVSPGLTYEQIVATLALQQRTTKKIWRKRKSSSDKKKKKIA